MTATQPTPPRSIQLLRFIAGGAWLLIAMLLASHAAQGIAAHFNLPNCEDLIERTFLLFLLVIGFALPYGVTRPGILRQVNALPQRSTIPQEFSRGAALGWAMVLLAVLPMALVGTLHPQFSFTLSSFGLTVISITTLAIMTLAIEVAFRGYLFTRLIALTSPVVATTVLSLLYAVLSAFRPNATSLSVLVTFLTGILFSIAYLRTNALWLGWGLHFAWDAAIALLFGLPIASYVSYTSVISTDTSGSSWLTGGPYGPEAAAFSAVVLLAAIPVLYRITRDYSWNYTHEPIVSAGYAMDIAPPAAHTEMEAAAAAKPAPLVQILGSTPTAASTMPIIDEHLRRESGE